MKYKLYLEEEYKDFTGDLEEDMTVECSDFIMLDFEILVIALRSLGYEKG